MPSLTIANPISEQNKCKKKARSPSSSIATFALWMCIRAKNQLYGVEAQTIPPQVYLKQPYKKF
jgi:hypothetical protein